MSFEGGDMVVYVVVAVSIVLLAGLSMSVRVLKQYERAVIFRLGRVDGGARGPGLIVFVPFVDRVHRVSLRIVTMPIQSQGIITRDNVSVDVSAVAYYRVAEAIRSVVAIENVSSAINQIAQPTLRAVVGRHTLDETLSETDTINQNIREILDVQTEEWGIDVTIVELKDIQLPESMKRAIVIGWRGLEPRALLVPIQVTGVVLRPCGALSVSRTGLARTRRAVSPSNAARSGSPCACARSAWASAKSALAVGTSA